MKDQKQTSLFVAAATMVGARAIFCSALEEAVAYVSEFALGPLLLPHSTGVSGDIGERLQQSGCEVIRSDFRHWAAKAAAGLTGADLAIAETGTVVLESTDEAVRLATTLPDRHFVLLDPDRIVADSAAAAPILRRMQTERPRSFVAWITGPSRTADIERVLTIGVHGPRELHILLVEGLSGDFSRSGSTPTLSKDTA